MDSSLAPKVIDETLLKINLAKYWQDPVKRAESIFNVKTSRGEIIPYRCPTSHAQLLREGPLGEARKLLDEGYVFKSVLNKGRQIGFSTVTAVENILMAEEFPNTTMYYIADDKEMAKDYLDKVTQLCRDANHYPEELGGGPILNVQELEPIYTKKINDTYITGLSGRKAKSKRGKNSPYVVWDEMAWCISVHKEQEDIWDTIGQYTKQGGCIRMQSTPRSTDDKFWQFFSKPQEYGMKSYYFPTIENWKELDLKQPLHIDLNNERRAMRQIGRLTPEQINFNIERYSTNPRFIYDKEKMEIRQRNIIIPYWWVKIEELEKERKDYEKFLQENLGVSVDEKYKVIPSEWIYRNISTWKELDGRWNSRNPFYILIDIAQKHDITAITIVEKMEGDMIIERKLDSSQEDYTVQVERIWGWFLKFKPQAISIDNTGLGTVIGDMLEKKLRSNGYPVQLLNRVNFTNQTKEVMAQGFKNLVQNNQYKFLNETDLHAQSIRHVERVEKILSETRVKGAEQGVRYSGKMWGRDDFFWSKAQIVYFTQLLMPTSPIAMGKAKNRMMSAISEQVKQTTPETIRTGILKDVKPNTFSDVMTIKNIGKAIKDLNFGIVDCPRTKQTENPIICTGCNWESCIHYDSMQQICNVHNVKSEKVWAKQKKYPDDYFSKLEGLNEERENDEKRQG